MLNLAVVGCGAIASRWLRVLNNDPRVTVAVLVDPDGDRALRLADRYDLRAATTATIEQAIASCPLDVAVNLTPPGQHAAVSRTALTAGLHVLTEKPLTTSLADALHLVRLARRVRRTLAVMANRIHDSGFLAFRDTVTAVPGPLAVAADTCVDLRDPGFRSAQLHLVTTDLAVHAFDQIQALIDATPTTISCHETPLPFLGAYCAVAAITVHFDDGSVFTYRGGFTRAGLATSAAGRWRVDGRHVAAQWPDPSTAAPTLGPAQEAMPGYQVCLIGMLDALHRTTPSVPSRANLRTIAMLDAALTSARTGSPAAVAPIPDLP